MPLELWVTAPRQPQEVQHGVVYGLRVGEEITAVHDVNAVTAEWAAEAGQLLRVLPARTVCVVLMAVTDVRGLGRDAFSLAGQTLRFEPHGSLEGLALKSPGALVRVRGVGTFYRVANQ